MAADKLPTSQEAHQTPLMTIAEDVRSTALTL